jgi:hypothetical protein
MDSQATTDCGAAPFDTAGRDRYDRHILSRVPTYHARAVRGPMTDGDEAPRRRVDERPRFGHREQHR